MTIDAVNRLDREAFVEAFGWIFEHSPWVAERAWKERPFGDARTLLGSMIRQVEMAAAAEQMALLREHPDLGTRAKLSDASAAEQAGAGLDQLTPAEFELFTKLNDGYKERFGFPFLYAVKGSNKQDILSALARRVTARLDEEYAEALRQVYRMAGFRLETCISEER
jgi:OHCU decarboxylase